MVKLCAPAVVLATLIWSTYQHALPYQVEDSSGYRYDDRIDAKRASGMDEVSFLLLVSLLTWFHSPISPIPPPFHIALKLID